jgi:hypothetical protein
MNGRMIRQPGLVHPAPDGAQRLARLPVSVRTMIGFTIRKPASNGNIPGFRESGISGIEDPPRGNPEGRGSVSADR